MSAAIHAASITKVPEPHMGSTRGRAGSHPSSRSVPAARVSRSGARVGCSRYPRRCRCSPDALARITKRSRTIRTTKGVGGRGASGAGAPTTAAARPSFTSWVATTTLLPDPAVCPTGGVEVSTGTDADGDGVLDAMWTWAPTTVRNLGGRIRAESAGKDQGTVMRIDLPLGAPAFEGGHKDG